MTWILLGVIGLAIIYIVSVSRDHQAFVEEAEPLGCHPE